jgi:hypothetical protein
VFPRLAAAEQACLLYVVRRTYGLSGETRKDWDRISLSQFVSGTQAGEFVLDLGTGLARSSAIRALTQLESKQLLKVSFECPTEEFRGKIRGCGWREDISLGNQLAGDNKCPRCGRSLAKAYSLRTLTPGFVRRFLTKTDPNGQIWEYHPELERFYVASTEQLEPASVEKSLEELQGQTQHNDLLTQIIEQAAEFNKKGSLGESRLRKGFYLPLQELEAQYPAQAVRYALEQVYKRRIAVNSSRRGWAPYARACAKGWLERQHGSRHEMEQAEGRENIYQILGECANLNSQGETTASRQLLDQLLSERLEEAAVTLGDRERARQHILEAFKRGIDDYEDPYAYASSADYLPEWHS